MTRYRRKGTRNTGQSVDRRCGLHQLQLRGQNRTIRGRRHSAFGTAPECVLLILNDAIGEALELRGNKALQTMRRWFAALTVQREDAERTVRVADFQRQFSQYTLLSLKEDHRIRQDGQSVGPRQDAYDRGQRPT